MSYRCLYEMYETIINASIQFQVEVVIHKILFPEYNRNEMFN